MSRITSSVGLITGIPIEETVNKLMAVAARPRELVVEPHQDDRRRAAGDHQAHVARAGVRVRVQSAVVQHAVRRQDGHVERPDEPQGDAYRRRQPGGRQLPVSPAANGRRPAAGQQQLAERRRPQHRGHVHVRLSAASSTREFRSSELNGGAGVRGGTIRITDRAGNVPTSTCELPARSTTCSVRSTTTHRPASRPRPTATDSCSPTHRAAAAI